MTTGHLLIELAHSADGPSRFRDGVLGVLCSHFEADVGIFVSIDHGREVRSLRGLRPADEARLDAAWNAVRREVAPVTAQALIGGVATDRDVLGVALLRTRLYRRVMAPVRGTETLFIAPSFAGRPLGTLALGRCGGTFSASARAEARRLVPVLSVASRAFGASSSPPMPCLTQTERDLLDYLELGWGTKAIAEARGTSFFTVRNQLSALYRKLEVTNRAEAIGLRHRTRP